MSFHICILGIDGSGKSTITKKLSATLASETKIMVATAGESLRMVDGKIHSIRSDHQLSTFSITARLAHYFKMKAKHHADNRKLYPLFKLLHMAFQDKAACQIETRYTPDVVISDGNLLLCTLGRAANYLQPASESKTSADTFESETTENFKAILAYLAEGNPLPMQTKQAFPDYKKAGLIRKMLSLFGIRKMLLPDLVIFLDVDAHTAMARIHNRGQKIDKHENIEDLNQAREMYLKTLSAYNLFQGRNMSHTVSTVDLNPEQVVQKIKDLLMDELIAESDLSENLEKFNVQNRQLLLKKLSNEQFDLVIIGGGVTGASVFRDAAMRGLKVALVEANDFSWGTSSRSSKLIHGGLRYLKQFKCRLTREACQERNLHIRLNHRLVEPLPFLLPIYKNSGDKKWFLRIGMFLYELLSGFQNYKRHQFLAPKQTLALAPGIPCDNLAGGCYYYDASVDDNRWTVEIIKDGIRNGGIALNYCRVQSLQTENGKIAGIHFEDMLNSGNYSVRARTIVNATGVWMDSVRRLENSTLTSRIRLSRGTHLVFNAVDIPIHVTTAFASPIDGRPIYLIKYDDYILFGTNDRWAENSPSEPVPSMDDVDYLLTSLNMYMSDSPLSKDKIRFIYSGFRPLVLDDSTATDPSDVCREDTIEISASGVIHIMGGKLTTARKIAERVVDVLIKQLGNENNFRKCKTDVIQIGPADHDKNIGSTAWIEQYPQLEQQIIRLYKRYGTDAHVICKMFDASANKSTASLTHAEIRYVCRHEMVCTLTDLMERRIGYLAWTVEQRLNKLYESNEVIQSELGLDQDEFELQLEEYRNYLEKYHSLPVTQQEIITGNVQDTQLLQAA
ncbi:FAD-dependent oxidoreductase [candidate division KSB1 bacterium]|nr:FAD-dependent oxidoreductase [candidate division KSB1 bacterium]